MEKKMFISQAFAQTAEAAQQTAAMPNGVNFFIQIILIFFILYFLLIRPQQKRIKEHQAHLNAIIKGTKIVINGILGTVKNVKDNELTVEIADGVEIKVLREYVSQVYLPKTDKSEKKK